MPSNQLFLPTACRRALPHEIAPLYCTDSTVFYNATHGTPITEKRKADHRARLRNDDVFHQ